MIRSYKKDLVPDPKIHMSIPEDMPLDVEVGCGVGFHALRYAQEHPQRYLLAMEKTVEKFNKLQNRLISHNPLQNLVCLHTNAIWWITHNLTESSVDRYFFLYPNPYPKDSQKRWFQMPFFSHVIETLKPGGEITLATNIQSYYEEASEYAQKVWKLEVVEATELPSGFEPRTHFEKKYLERGETCYNLVVRKSSDEI